MGATDVIRPVKFLHPWRGRKVGEVATDFPFGVASALVHRNIAQWHETDSSDRKADTKSRKR